jgi:hypothetical protein
MAQYVCAHHNGILVYGSDGIQRQIGGQNAAVTLSAQNGATGAPANPGRSNAGLAFNRTVPSVATIGDAATVPDGQSTIQRNNPGTAPLFASGVLTQIG